MEILISKEHKDTHSHLNLFLQFSLFMLIILLIFLRIRGTHLLITAPYLESGDLSDSPSTLMYLSVLVLLPVVLCQESGAPTRLLSAAVRPAHVQAPGRLRQSTLSTVRSLRLSTGPWHYRANWRYGSGDGDTFRKKACGKCSHVAQWKHYITVYEIPLVPPISK